MRVRVLGGGAHGRVVLWQYTMHHSLCVQTADCLVPAGESQLALSAALLGLQRLKVERHITIESTNHHVKYPCWQPPTKLAVPNGKLGGWGLSPLD